MQGKDAIIARIRSCQTLPSLPMVAVEVLRLVRCDEVGLDDIAGLISNDPGLSGKILKTVNSPFYGLSKPVTTISSALVILGIETVKTLTLGFSLVSSLQETGARGATQLAYWRRSLYAAVAARLLCQRLGVAEPEELFLAALLQDVGVQVLKQTLGDEYDQMLSQAEAWTTPLSRRVRAAFGIDHAEAGLLLAEQWHLPPVMKQAIRWHHCPRRAEPEFRTRCRMVRLSSLCAEVFMDQASAGRHVAWVRRYARAAFKMGEPACDLLLTEIAGRAQEMADLFAINIGEQKPYEAILAEATATLQDMTIRSQLQARQLRARAETDPLTGLANRGKLEQSLESEFERAVRFLRPLSVLFIDADHFKRINDTLGHAAGDEALRSLADVIRSHIRPVDIAARYGGEEFVVLLPEMPLADAADLAEKIRAAIQAHPPVLAGSSYPLTISAGVAGCSGPGLPYKMGSQLVQAADRAVYAAKASGRNTVRVFSPKPRKPASTT